MKKNKLIPFSLLFIALVFLELFCIVKYADVYYFPLCVGLTLIGSAYLLLTEIDNVVTTYIKDKERASMPDEDTIARREEASKIAKATYVLEKRILNLLDERILSPEENMENLSTLEGEIVHAIKASIKYGRDNTNHLSEVIAESSTATDYEDILAKLDELILVLKNNPIAPSTAQAPVEQVNYEEVPVEPIMTAAETVVEDPVIETGTETEDVPEFVDTLTTETTPEEHGATEIEPEFASELEPEPVAGANAVPEPSTAPIDSDPNKPMSPDEIAALIAAAEAQSEPEIEAAPEPTPTAPIDSDPNKPMSPEDIAALIAATEDQSEPEIEVTPEPTPTAPVDSDPNKPMSPEDIAALIAAAEAESAPEPEPTPAPVDSDPNKPMSPDEIAALIAAAEAESVPEPKTAPVATAPVDSDPNKPMNPDEIVALIAATEAGSASEVEAKAEPVVETKAAPVPSTPAVDDPNKQMSPEDIAALFASSNLELEPEPSAAKPKTAIEALSKHETSPASDDPNKPMSPDDIAALIASLGQ